MSEKTEVNAATRHVILTFSVLCFFSLCSARADVTPRKSQPEDSVARPATWPQAHSVGLVDARTERLIDDLMARLSLEEKVGQMIQADIASIKPDDLRSYPLGSVLAGGNSPPLSETIGTRPPSGLTRHGAFTRWLSNAGPATCRFR